MATHGPCTANVHRLWSHQEEHRRRGSHANAAALAFIICRGVCPWARCTWSRKQCGRPALTLSLTVFRAFVRKCYRGGCIILVRGHREQQTNREVVLAAASFFVRCFSSREVLLEEGSFRERFVDLFLRVLGVPYILRFFFFFSFFKHFVFLFFQGFV